MKNVEIEVRDDAGVEQMIGFDFPLNAGSFNDLRLLIKEIFKEELNKLSSFLSDEVYVRVVNRKPKTIGSR